VTRALLDGLCRVTVDTLAMHSPTGPVSDHLNTTVSHARQSPVTIAREKQLDVINYSPSSTIIVMTRTTAVGA
jgi:hypothetical protein